METRFRAKEQRQQDSIEEVMKFVKEKLYTADMKTTTSLNNMQSLLNTNDKMATSKFETMKIDVFARLASVSERLIDKYWTESETK